MSEATAKLMAHAGARAFTREQLVLLPSPAPTRSFRPVPHIELVEAIEAALPGFGLGVRETSFAVSQNLQTIFGVMKLDSIDPGEDFSAALGFRAANDRSMSIQMIAGLNVFVCDNMAFSGENVILRRKHTSGLRLADEISAGLAQYMVKFQHLRSGVLRQKAREIAQGEAQALVFRASFVDEVWPQRRVREVWEEYNKPRHEEFKEPTLWALHNAFTEVAKGLNLEAQLRSAQGLSRLFARFLDEGRTTLSDYDRAPWDDPEPVLEFRPND